MSRIPTWQQIETGEIPKLEDFMILVNYIRSILFKCDSVLGAMICGSVAHGKQNLRSDLDLVAIHKQNEFEHALLHLREIAEIAKQFHIPLEHICICETAAQNATHDINGSFYDHLHQDFDNCFIIKENPLIFLKRKEMESIEDALDYISRKIRKIKQKYIDYPLLNETDRCRFLSKMLDSPISIARKVLTAKGIVFPAGDSKSEVLKLYPILKNEEALLILEEAVALDEQISKEINFQLADKNEERYSELIAKIVAFIPKSIRFAELSLSILIS